MNTMGASSLSSEINRSLYLFIDHFSNYVVTVPTPKITAPYNVKSSFHKQKSKFGIP